MGEHAGGDLADGDVRISNNFRTDDVKLKAGELQERLDGSKTNNYN